MHAGDGAVPRDDRAEGLTARDDVTRPHDRHDRLVARHHPAAVVQREHGAVDHGPCETDDGIRGGVQGSGGRPDVDAAMPGRVGSGGSDEGSHDRSRRIHGPTPAAVPGTGPRVDG